ncbi:class I SAM-dependent methyltransferase [Falsarthrobacter nasiphocae]|uniref:Class I SAM-dependent methyltransferase n=1 Tax=Falsarthrobacter nasiphocae TaxID=189863 RepID=A0AAE4C4X4_9MICC|nr:class I SAM-dependent methyltransferase [Falsarthrobacter nasiphocae]MDR6891771.1 hypothetical protein [Falsarthrobacter nasiphocae]
MVEKSRELAVRPGRPVGHVTRGTTAANRMRRVDRWLCGTHASVLTRAARPLVVDLGFGAAPWTAAELFRRVRAVAPDAELMGLEIEQARVALARAVEEPGLSFELGGFELATPRPPRVVRAFNVLRQYEEKDVPGIWATMAARLDPGGVLIEGTCDEVGRTAAWVCLGQEGPRTLTLAVNPWLVSRPSDVAERLPKALIHRNVPGEPVHRLLAEADRAWDRAAAHGAFSPRQRWAAMARALTDAGLALGRAPYGGRVLGGPARWRLGELTVPWSVARPADGPLAG